MRMEVAIEIEIDNDKTARWGTTILGDLLQAFMLRVPQGVNGNRLPKVADLGTRSIIRLSSPHYEAISDILL